MRLKCFFVKNTVTRFILFMGALTSLLQETIHTFDTIKFREPANIIMLLFIAGYAINLTPFELKVLGPVSQRKFEQRTFVYVFSFYCSDISFSSLYLSTTLFTFIYILKNEPGPFFSIINDLSILKNDNVRTLPFYDRTITYIHSFEHYCTTTNIPVNIEKTLYLLCPLCACCVSWIISLLRTVDSLHSFLPFILFLSLPFRFSLQYSPRRNVQPRTYRCIINSYYLSRDRNHSNRSPNNRDGFRQVHSQQIFPRLNPELQPPFLLIQHGRGSEICIFYACNVLHHSVTIKVRMGQIKLMIKTPDIKETESPIEHKKDRWEPYTDNEGFHFPPF